jgi:hypothetical protein
MKEVKDRLNRVEDNVRAVQGNQEAHRQILIRSSAGPSIVRSQVTPDYGQWINPEFLKSSPKLPSMPSSPVKTEELPYM